MAVGCPMCSKTLSLRRPSPVSTRSVQRHRFPHRLSFKNRTQHFPLPPSKTCSTRCRRVLCRAATSKGVGIFPAGQQQAKVKLPGLFLEVRAAEILSEGCVLDIVGDAVLGGATGIILYEDVDSTSSAADLYDAACKLREVLRGRAALLVVDRTDIADAANADGVLLTPRGVPIGVARRTLKSKAVLVGQLVDSPSAARKSAAQGASLVVMQGQGGGAPVLGDVKEGKSRQKGGAIPVIARLGADVSREVADMVSSGIDGVVLGSNSVRELGSVVSGGDLGVADSAKVILEGLEKSEKAGKSEKGAEGGLVVEPKPRLISEKRESLVSEEKGLLLEILELLDEVSPEMSEVSLLKGALQQLDELFLIVVVGEYNSGKSSVINSLLGSKFLEEGFLPTTNEISILRFSQDGKAKVARNADGIVERFLPADLLREVSIVDTPGTNVVLERQQRLTEEYVPRADMVLFVMSADRPFTESEVNFLKYIRTWGKKVVFVVNKSDILADESEVEQLREFVGDNARNLLNLDEAFVWPVSARKALQAKESTGNSKFAGYQSTNDMGLSNEADWRESRFEDLEEFILAFFSGNAGEASAESVRLKLQTPLSVADALLDACKRQLENERNAVEKDLAAVRAVRTQLEAFSAEMKKDSVVQRQAARKLLDEVVLRTERFVDDTLQLSNIQTLQGYLQGRGQSKSPQVAKGFGSMAMGNVVDDLKSVLDEHASWVTKNLEIQIENYQSFAENCAAQKEMSLQGIMEEYGGSQERWGGPTESVEDTSSKAESTSDSKSEEEPLEASLGTDSVVQKVLDNPSLGVELCERLIEGEISDAVNATAGTALAAVGVGVLLTFILPYTSEDFLAIALSLLIGYIALLNLPLRRGQVKGKIRTVSTNIFNEMDGRMDKELASGLVSCNDRVAAMVDPLEILYEGDLERVKMYEENRLAIFEELQGLKSRIANIE